jgi:BASS family bile acid:Na+ symporter
MDIDLVRLNLNQNSINVLNGIIAIIMFGVALNLRFSDFTQLFKKPGPFLIGLLGYYLIFPLLTLGIVILMAPRPSMALGLVLVASCPSGNLANVFTNLCKGNTALTVGLVSFTTLLSTLSIPFLLLVVGKNVQGAQSLMADIKLDSLEMFKGVFFLLAIPLFLGMISAKMQPLLSQKIHKFLNKASFIVLIIFVLGALFANFQHFLDYFFVIMGVVLVHTAMAIGLGLLLGRLISKDHRNIIALSFFMGVRNTALGLALVFQFFGGLGGMALIVAFYGIAQISIGMLLTQFWKRIYKQKEAL